MKNLFAVFAIMFSAICFAEPLESLVTIDDGLDLTNNENISDDFIRLTLVAPSYQTANAIKTAIEDWLGPNMVILESASALKIQAPRDSTKRVAFISALLNLDIK